MGSVHFPRQFSNRLCMSLSTLVALEIVLKMFIYRLENAKNVGILRRFSQKTILECAIFKMVLTKIHLLR